MGTRVEPLNLDDFMFTEREDNLGRRYVEFEHVPTGYGLAMHVPRFLVKGTQEYNHWRYGKLTETVEPLVRKVIEYGRSQEDTKAG